MFVSAYRVLRNDVTAARHDLGLALGVTMLAMIVVPAIMGFDVDFLSFWPAVFFAAIPAAFIPYVSWRRMWVLRSILELSCCSFILVVPVLVLTYGCMRFNMPMADTTLINLDRTLGFDWTAFVLLVDQSAFASSLLETAYGSLMKQMVLLPALLCLLQFQARAYQLMTALIALSFLSAIVSIPFPSVGAYVGHGLDGKSLENINAYFGYFFIESFNAVRAQDHFVLTLTNSAGIITFPSGHAAFAVLSMWAAWPSRWLRYPVLALNVLMIVSAITHGAHYFVDVIAGSAVAMLAIMIATRQLPRIPSLLGLVQLAFAFGRRQPALPHQINP